MAYLYIVIILVFLAGIIAVAMTMDKEEVNK